MNNKIQHFESQKGRIYRKGLPLTYQEILTIHVLFEKGLTEEQVAKETKLDIRTVRKYSNGNSSYGVGGNRKFNQNIIQFIENLVKLNPAIYLREIQKKMEEDLNIKRSISTIESTLHKAGYTRKKAVKICYYRSTERVQLLRNQFRETVKAYHPHIFFYLDESHFESEDLERNFGWSKKGEKVQTNTHKFSPKTYTLIAALSCFGLIYYEIIDTTKIKVNGERFKVFIENLVRITPENIVYYMDNAKIHHVGLVIGFLESMGVEYLFSSPYSPDYNPIEIAFGWIKTKIKSYQDISLVNAIEKAISEITPELSCEWIKHCAVNWTSDAL